MKNTVVIVLALSAALMAAAISGCGRQQSQPVQKQTSSEVEKLTSMTARFAPVDIIAPVDALGAREQEALAGIIEAAKVIDTVYLRQVWSGNEPMLLDLSKDTSDAGRARLHYFMLNKGPWSRLDHNAPFVPSAPPKPAQANFYPSDATKGEVEAWLKTLSPAEEARASGFFTTIRRGSDRKLVAVPYSLEYQGVLSRAAELLRQAAERTLQPTLKAFLQKRADAFISNDYYASDVAWMEIDASIEPTIGPYEVYEDEWFNAKAAFEAFITLPDGAETNRLRRLSDELQGIEDNLPIDPKYRNRKLGGMAPIRVVNTVFAAGDGNRGVQTAAFNLPNDERIVAEKGSKRVMLKNYQEAKFNMVLLPISRIALSPADQANVDFDAFFTHILMHELMHGLGPHNISVAGRATTVRQELKDLYSAVEEAKADVSGLFAMQFLVDHDRLGRRFEETMYNTYLASMFRSIRFGLNEAHGRGVAVQLNYFLDHGGITAGSGTFAVNPERLKQNVVALTRDIMTMQAVGSYADARKMLDTLTVIRPPVQSLLDKLKDVPVDIEPRFVTAEQLLARPREGK